MSTAVVCLALGTAVVIDLYDLIGTVSLRFRFQKLPALPVCMLTVRNTYYTRERKLELNRQK
jgi:hypothetical protein